MRKNLKETRFAIEAPLPRNLADSGLRYRTQSPKRGTYGPAPDLLFFIRYSALSFLVLLGLRAFIQFIHAQGWHPSATYVFLFVVLVVLLALCVESIRPVDPLNDEEENHIELLKRALRTPRPGEETHSPVLRLLYLGLFVVFGPFMWLSTFMLFDGVSAAWVVFGLAIGVAYLLAEKMAEHLTAWASDSLSYSYEDRKSMVADWKNRYRSKSPHWDGVLFIGMAAGVAAIPLIFNPEELASITGLAAFILFTIVLMIGSGLFSSRVSLANDERISKAKATWLMVKSWLTYNPHQTRAPGVHLSTGGTCKARVRLTLVAIAALSFGSLTLTAFFPAGLLLTGPEPWVERVARVRPGSIFHRPGSLPKNTDRATLNRVFIDKTNARRDVWFYAALYGLFDGKWVFPVSLLLGVLFCVGAPLGLLFLVLVTVGGSTALTIYTDHRVHDDHLPDHERWERETRILMDQFRTYKGDPVEGPKHDNLFLGYAVHGDHPVLMDRSILDGHGIVNGGTKMGKTALALTPLQTQLIGRADSSHLILDQKGDPAMFRNAMETARKAGLPFKWFTNRPEYSSFIFNPLTQSHMPHLTANQKAQSLLQGLSLEYGADYGRAYFSSTNEELLRMLFLEFGHQINSFSDLADLISRPKLWKHRVGGGERALKDASALALSVNRLANIYPLNAKGPQRAIDDAIDLPSLFSKPQVVYFFLNAPLEATSVRTVATLALYGLITAAPPPMPSTSGESNSNCGRVYVTIDEFQEVISDNVTRVLEMARSSGISMLLANQSMASLDKPGARILEEVHENTHFKLTLSAQGNKQRQEIERASGEARYSTRSGATTHSEEGVSRTWGWGEETGPRLSPNDIIEMSAKKNRGIVRFAQSTGLTRYSGYSFELEMLYHISPQRFAERTWGNAAWPTNSAAVDVVPSETTEAISPTKESHSENQGGGPRDAIEAHLRSMQARHMELFETLKKNQARGA